MVMSRVLLCVALAACAALAQPPPPPGSVCNLPTSGELFHEMGQGVHNPKVFSIAGEDSTHFRIHSLNNSFEDTTATITMPPPGSTELIVNAYFSDIKANSTGRLLGTGNCSTILWATTQGGFKEWVVGGLRPLPPPCKFYKELFHDQIPSSKGYGTYTLDTVDASHVSIHSNNGSFTDTTATVDPPDYCGQNITAHFSDLGQTLTGTVENGCYFIVFGPSERPLKRWMRGPLPPPPPPPPSECPNQYNKTACDSLKPSSPSSKGCSWCTSTDKFHQLCFDLATVPNLDKKDWTCDNSN